MTGFFEKVYRLVSLIPYGRVANYGQIAGLLGEPRAARTVGWALHGLPEGSEVPWHRVINVAGRISNPCEAHGEDRQRSLLEAEGVVFDSNGRTDMSFYRWEGPNIEELDCIHRSLPRRSVSGDESGE